MPILQLEMMFSNFQYMVIIRRGDQIHVWWRNADSLDLTLIELIYDGTRYTIIKNEQYNNDRDRGLGAKATTEEVLRRIESGELVFPPGEQHLLKEYNTQE